MTSPFKVTVSFSGLTCSFAFLTIFSLTLTDPPFRSCLSSFRLPYPKFANILSIRIKNHSSHIIIGYYPFPNQQKFIACYHGAKQTGLHHDRLQLATLLLGFIGPFWLKKFFNQKYFIKPIQKNER